MIRKYLTTMLEPSIVKRGLKYSAIVGTLLVLINQSDALAQGSMNATQIWQILLTYTVPYLVSSLSSAQAIFAEEGVPSSP